MEQAFPWLTASGCGTHVLSLELKDLAKIPEVAAIISKMGVILSLFWGRKRWPRRKLREVILQNHGRSFGLYRAKVTRFAGVLLPQPTQPTTHIQRREQAQGRGGMPCAQASSASSGALCA